MNTVLKKAVPGTVVLGLLMSQVASAREWRLDADISARGEYNDNLFMTPSPYEPVKSQAFVLAPSVKGTIKEKHWQTDVAARLRSNNYSDSNLSSNDKYFDLTGKYNAERNIFSLNFNYDLDSNLNATSPDFAIVGRRINRKKQGLTPSYTRSLTERSFLTLSYTYSDVEYLDAGSTGYVSYISQSGVISWMYSLTETDSLTASITVVDYVSKDELLTYQMFMPRLGIEHAYSQTLKFNLTIGGSRRNSTNKNTQSYDFFGQPVTVTREIDSRDRGYVLDAGFEQTLETGKWSGSIARNNTTSSFGGLNQVDSIKLGYNNRLSELLRYSFDGRFEDYSAISSGTRNTDRKVLFLEAKASYTLSRHWFFNVSYRFTQRRFKSASKDGRAPYSNRIYAGLTYNFPEISTF